MNVLFINLLLALVWTFLTGSFTPNTLIEGFIVGYLVLWLASPLYGPSTYFKKFRQTISFLFFFLRELVSATLKVAYVVIKPDMDVHPGIVAIPLTVTTNTEITLLANLITLTPGTLTLDISSDRRVMYVHVMNVTDVEAFRQEIRQGFERRVGELLR
ncbi:MAG: Na+/H+ antiporter subunit E [Chloroflexi bacterium]|nr:Na+/H+ antiporter subunit E [Chloroflexota bacterium]